MQKKIPLCRPSIPIRGSYQVLLPTYSDNCYLLISKTVAQHNRYDCIFYFVKNFIFMLQSYNSFYKSADSARHMRSLKMRNNPRIQQTLTKTLSETRYSWDLKHIYTYWSIWFFSFSYIKIPRLELNNGLCPSRHIHVLLYIIHTGVIWVI